jgi:sugar lactone lactonase YvrE
VQTPPEIAPIAQTEDVIGEVPVWSVEEQALYWIDIFKPAIHRWTAADDAVASWTPPEKLGAMALTDGGRLLLAARSGLAVFVPETGEFEIVSRPEADRPDNILNEGRCDRRGRFWFGSMDRQLRRDLGRLHRFDAGSSCRLMDKGVWIPNGLAWSPDDRVLYFADSHRKLIFAYEFDLDSGEIGDRRIFADTGRRPGVPDGAAIDAEGFLWSAQWDAGCLIRYSPDGRVDRMVELPVSRPAACAFGGAGLATLFVTTARFRLSSEALAAQPLAGGVLALDVGVRGLPESRYREAR